MNIFTLYLSVRFAEEVSIQLRAVLGVGLYQVLLILMMAITTFDFLVKGGMYSDPGAHMPTFISDWALLVPNFGEPRTWSREMV